MTRTPIVVIALFLATFTVADAFWPRIFLDTPNSPMRFMGYLNDEITGMFTRSDPVLVAASSPVRVSAKLQSDDDEDEDEDESEDDEDEKESDSKPKAEDKEDEDEENEADYEDKEKTTTTTTTEKPEAEYDDEDDTEVEDEKPKTTARPAPQPSNDDDDEDEEDDEDERPVATRPPLPPARDDEDDEDEEEEKPVTRATTKAPEPDDDGDDGFQPGYEQPTPSRRPVPAAIPTLTTPRPGQPGVSFPDARPPTGVETAGSTTDQVSLGEGQTFSYFCRATHWYRNGWSGLQHKAIVTENALWIHDLTLSDSGTYRCLVGSKQIHDVTLTVRPKETTPRPGLGHDPEQTLRPHVGLPKWPNVHHPFTCSDKQFTCRNGDCIDLKSFCNGRIDCRDASDEVRCTIRSLDDGVRLWAPDTPQTEPPYRDVVFRCRDKSVNGARVYWTREAGRPLQPKVTYESDRIHINSVEPDDSGVYECHVQGHPDMIAKNFLNVSDVLEEAAEKAWPKPKPAPAPICGQGEINCRSGKCIPRSRVCNGFIDCDDKSDELSCPVGCGPSHFRCDNNLCIDKSKYCNGIDDCGDQSDESRCNAKQRYGKCSAFEKKCPAKARNVRKCISRAYMCDKYPDCPEGTDEDECLAPHSISIASNVTRVRQGSTVNLSCRAAGYPRPRIAWRFNMDYVPMHWPSISLCSKRLSSTEAASILTIHDIDDSLSGPWTCEAVNAVGFRLVDSDVRVDLVEE